MEEDKVERACRNCVHYFKFYIKPGDKFIWFDGTCMNDEMNKRRGRKKFRYCYDCDLWQCAENKEEEIKKTETKKENATFQDIQTLLARVSAQLEQIKSMLKVDGKNKR